MTKKKQTKKAVAPKGKKVPKEFRIKISEQQILERGKALAKLGTEETAKEEAFKTREDEWKAEKAKHKSEMKNYKEQRKKLDEEINTKSALITEDTVLVLNHDEHRAEYWYNSPLEGWIVVDTRALEENERQLSLVEDEAEKMPEEGQEIEE